MNDWELRRKIAEACGWLNIHPTGRLDGRLVGTNPEHPIIGQYEEVPDYFLDLNAIHKAEQILTSAQHQDFYVALMLILREKFPYATLPNRAVSATARQRSEAFLEVRK